MGRHGRRHRSGWHRSVWVGIALTLAPIALVSWSIWRGHPQALWDGRLLAQSQPRDPSGSSDPLPVVRDLPVGNDRAPSPSIDTTPPPPAAAPPASVESLLTSARAAITRGDLVAARIAFSAAMGRATEESQFTSIRTDLGRISNETVLSPRIFPNDPLAERYVLRPGDTLGKIAKSNRLAVEFLAEINGIADVNRIREGQTIKVVKGPFRAVVTKSTYSLDVYLGDTFVRRFAVGLGADDSTPTGEWRVSTKLKDPTYYPPRGGTIIAADDPANPLGERWIGLEGISGEAVDQQRYGIHGTNEPDSIGKSVSMGCVRLRNEDAEALYTYLVETHSTVRVND